MTVLLTMFRSAEVVTLYAIVYSLPYILKKVGELSSK